MQDQNDRSEVAILFMLVAVFLYSAFPLVGVFGTVKVSGFVFAGIGHLLSAIVSILGASALAKMLKSYNFSDLLRDIWSDKRALSQAVQSGVVNYFSHAFLFASFVHISKATASIVYEVWPIIALVFLALFHPKKSKEKRKNYFEPRDLLLSFAAFVGLAIIIMDPAHISTSVQSGLSFVFSDDGKIGLLYAVLSALFMAYSVALGRNTRLFVEDQYGTCVTSSDQVNRALIASSATKIFGAVAFLVSLPFLDETAAQLGSVDLETLSWAVLNGVVIVTLGSLSYREALARSNRAELTIMWYLTPVLALLWLWVAGVEDITITVGVGATLIISANALLQMRADTSPAFIGVFLSVAITGAVVIFSTPLILDDYFTGGTLIDLLALPVGFIGILGGFLLERVSSLHSDSLRHAMALVDYTKSKLPETDLNETIRSTETRHRLPDEIQNHARDLLVAESPIIKAGELLVMWTLSSFCIVTIVLFRANSVVGDALALVVVPSLIYILMHISFDGRIQLRTVLSKANLGVKHSSISRQNIWSLIIIGLVAATLIFLSLIKHLDQNLAVPL